MKNNDLVNMLIKVFTLITLVSSLLAIKTVDDVRDIMVVTSANEFPGDPHILEIFDFQGSTWRQVEKSEIIPTSISAGSNRKKGLRAAEAMVRPGTARLVDGHDVLQFELNDGLALRLATYPEHVEGASILEYGDTVCLVGGYDTELNMLRNTVLCWNPLNPNPAQVQNTSVPSGWLSLPPMNQARYKPGSVVLDGKLYVAGGYDSSNHKYLSSVEVFDDVSLQWFPQPDLLQARAGHQLSEIGGKIYAMGGWFNRTFLNKVERFDPIKNAWENVASMDQARSDFATVTQNGTIVVVGGVKGFRQPRDFLSSMESYDVKKDTWNSEKPRMGKISGPTRATLVHDVHPKNESFLKNK